MIVNVSNTVCEAVALKACELSLSVPKKVSLLHFVDLIKFRASMLVIRGSNILPPRQYDRRRFCIYQSSVIGTHRLDLT